MPDYPLGKWGYSPGAHNLRGHQTGNDKIIIGQCIMHIPSALIINSVAAKTKLKKQQEKSITKLGKLDDLGFINIVAPTNMSESSATTTVDQSGDRACNELNSSNPEDMIPLEAEALSLGSREGGGGGPFKITSLGAPVTLNPALIVA